LHDQENSVFVVPVCKSEEDFQKQLLFLNASRGNTIQATLLAVPHGGHGPRQQIRLNSRLKARNIWQIKEWHPLGLWIRR
jgi:hypothetical protein